MYRNNIVAKSNGIKEINMFSINNNEITISRGDSGQFTIAVNAIVDNQEQAYEMQEGDTLTFTVKKNANDTAALIQKTGTTINILPTDTAGLTAGDYLYDVKFESNGDVDHIIQPTRFTVMEAL